MAPWLHQFAAQFATALLLTGALFDAIGLFRKTERFLLVSFWNLGAWSHRCGRRGRDGARVAVRAGAAQPARGPLLGFHRFGGYVVAICAVGLTAVRIAMQRRVKPGAHRSISRWALHGGYPDHDRGVGDDAGVALRARHRLPDGSTRHRRDTGAAREARADEAVTSTRAATSRSS